MSDKETPIQATPEEIKLEEELAANGSVDIRKAMIGYAKSFAGYPYISASRIERMPDKNEKHSFLLEQMMVNYLIKNKGQQVNDFMEVFGNGKLVFIQAHARCPTVCADGLYNAVDIEGKFIKTQLVGHFVIDEDKLVETEDERIEKDYSYFYIDNNEQYMEIQSDPGTPLGEYRKNYGKIFRRLTRPNFEPMIIVSSCGKDGKKQFGMIKGNPYHTLTTSEVAAILNEGSIKEN